MDHSLPAETAIVAERYLALLASRGVKYLFGNGGACSRTSCATTYAPQVRIASRRNASAAALVGPRIDVRQDPAWRKSAGFGRAEWQEDVQRGEGDAQREA